MLQAFPFRKRHSHVHWLVTCALVLCAVYLLSCVTNAHTMPLNWTIRVAVEIFRCYRDCTVYMYFRIRGSESLCTLYSNISCSHHSCSLKWFNTTAAGYFCLLQQFLNHSLMQGLSLPGFTELPTLRWRLIESENGWYSVWLEGSTEWSITLQD